MFVTAIALLASMQTDFGVRVPPGAPTGPPKVENVTVVRPKHRAVQSKPNGSFSCAVQSVHDGDTFRCTNGTRVRLSSIDSPEMPGACRPGRNCAPGDPYAAKAALEGLFGGRTIQCQPVGTSYDRVAAWCSANGVDLSCALVRSGHAIRLPQYDTARRLCR
jgi:endonuclease YncB( thermonuclease family)